jgi:hypothetical protein
MEIQNLILSVFGSILCLLVAITVFSFMWNAYAHPYEKYVCREEGSKILSIKSCGGGFLSIGRSNCIYETEAGEASYYGGYVTGDVLPIQHKQVCEWQTKQ